MSTIDDGGPAFPVIGNEGEPSPGDGMTLRDYFAAKALSAMDLQIVIANPAAEMMARSAYVVADAMLAARKGGAA